MAAGRTGGVIVEVDRLLRSGTVAAMTEGQLLGRFAADRDEASFAALVAIHGPMVLGASRRMLDDPSDVDDAFQATFLVLARKAGSIRRPELLGPWLHGVTRRVAARIRKQVARRRSVERSGAEAAAMTRDDDDRGEIASALDEEIGRLPERLRRPIVLCYLEGRTQEEAARSLRWTVGTLRGRLAKAREVLQSRLARRGLAPSRGSLGTLVPFSFPAAPTAVPPPLAASTARAAALFAAGRTASAGAVPASASALAEGVLRTMIASPRTIAAALLAAAAGLATLPFAFASPHPDDPPPPRAEAQAAPAIKPSAEAIIARVAKTYADARSYSDEGEVTLVFTDATSQRIQGKPFSTRFVRPRLFRFEFTERDFFNQPNRYVIWTDTAPERSKTWWTIRPNIEEHPLDLAVGAAAGVSSRSSHIIPRLLMPGVVQGQSLIDLKGLRLAGEDIVDGALCDKIEGTTPRGDPETVWIDETTNLVRKVAGTIKIPGATVEQTTVYRPRLNVEIAPKEFAFTPPGAPGP
jgi:RNA polymerase sigma factor (sigma-70 family)